MRSSVLACLALSSLLLGQQPDPAKHVVGRWEGESICTVPNSPCHDEHVVYHIARDQDDAAKLRMQAFKIVNRKEEYMGDVICSLDPHGTKLSCTANTTKKDDWEFQISGDTLTGTLTIGEEKTLYRRVRATKAPRP
jgi:hypothetical protein